MKNTESPSGIYENHPFFLDDKPNTTKSRKTQNNNVFE